MIVLSSKYVKISREIQPEELMGFTGADIEVLSLLFNGDLMAISRNFNGL